MLGTVVYVVKWSTFEDFFLSRSSFISFSTCTALWYFYYTVVVVVRGGLFYCDIFVVDLLFFSRSLARSVSLSLLGAHSTLVVVLISAQWACTPSPHKYIHLFCAHIKSYFHWAHSLMPVRNANTYFSFDRSSPSCVYSLVPLFLAVCIGNRTKCRALCSSARNWLLEFQ